MATWFSKEVHEEYLDLYEDIKTETEEHVRRERGESGFDDPDFVWQVAQDAPTYRGVDTLVDYLKLADSVYESHRQEIDWNNCSRRINQYVNSDHKEPMSAVLPTDYARQASEEIILHAITYQLTGEGHTR